MEERELRVVVGGSRISAVLLDLDDTLFDHRESARRGLGRWVQELGARPTTHLEWFWECTAMQLMARRRAGEIDRDDYRRLRVRTLLAEIGRGEEAERLDGDECDRLYDRFLVLYEQEWVAFEDALPVLRALEERDVPAAILTNGPEERQQRKVRALGIAPFVVGVWTSEQLGAKKPAPSTYLTVCDALGLDPAGVLHLGDNLEHDLHGARAVGLRALHLDRRRDHAAAPERIGGLAELLERI